MKKRLLKNLTTACMLLFAFVSMAISASAAGATQPVSTTGSGIQFTSPFSFNPLWIWVILCGVAIVIVAILVFAKDFRSRREAK